MGFLRRHNDALLMFCLRHYGQDAGGKRTTINYFSTRASAGAVAGTSPLGVSTASTGSGQASPDTNGNVGLDASGTGAASGAGEAAGATGAGAQSSDDRGVGSEGV